jgi:subtilisin family serine protease
MRLPPVLGLLLCALAGAADAQLLPAGPALPQLPGGTVGDTLQHTLDDPTLRTPLAALRQLRIDGLLHNERRRVDVDAHGQPVLRGEFLLLDGSPATLAAAVAAGFTEVRRDHNDLGFDIVVLRDTRDRSATRAMRALQEAAPQAEFAYQHIYLPAGVAPPRANGPSFAKFDGASYCSSFPRKGEPTSGCIVSADAPSRRMDSRFRGNDVNALAMASDADVSLRVGLIDGGVDVRDPAFAAWQMQQHGCEGTSPPDPHATAVARRLVEGARGTLYAADLWCGDRVGRATLGLVDALAWMAREHVPVINISLVGPDNPVLARAIAAMVTRGHVLVAAVGNDGPAAPPLFPASYAGVIGVSGVDAKLRALPEAASGPQVDFAAPGVVGSGRRALRGTSFAAPIVARLAAMRVHASVPGAGTQAQAALAAQARDLGAPGRDPRYGDGLLGAIP